MSIFKDKIGDKIGIKRTVGFVVVMVSIILAIIDQFSQYKVNTTLWLTMFASGMAMIGITVIPKLK